MKSPFAPCCLALALLSWALATSSEAHSTGGLLGVGMDGGARTRHAAPVPRRTRMRVSQARAMELEQVIRHVFGRYGEQAVRIARCESSMDPTQINEKEDARGLFQIRKAAWSETRLKHRDRLDPLANIAGAFEIFARSGYSWRKWGCKNKI